MHICAQIKNKTHCATRSSRCFARIVARLYMHNENSVIQIQSAVALGACIKIQKTRSNVFGPEYFRCVHTSGAQIRQEDATNHRTRARAMLRCGVYETEIACTDRSGWQLTN